MLPRDDDQVLELLRRPPPPFSQMNIVIRMCKRGREPLVRRAVNEGIVQMERQPELLTALAAKGSLSLLRCLISEGGGDPNQRGADDATPLLAAFCCEDDRNALYLINEAGADANA